MNKIVNNISWLIFDKLLILLLHFFIGVKIANYYGSTIYGTYNYMLSLVSFSDIFFEIINGRVIKKYYTTENYSQIVFNVTFFRNSIAITIFLFCIAVGKFLKIDNLSYLILVFLALDNVFLTITTGIENFYEYKLEIKKVVISNNLVKILSYLLQYVGILFAYPIVMLTVVRCIGSFIRMILLKYTYRRSYYIHMKNTIDKELISKIIKDSFYLWGSFVAFIIYTQVDKIMLGILLGKKEVGVYSIGIQLAQIMAIIIPPIQTIVFTKMLVLYGESYKKYINFYLKVNTIITQIYIIGVILSIFVVKKGFLYVFSLEYKEAISVYFILVISVLMKANGALQTGHMTLKNITKKSFYKTVTGVFINSLLNYFLILKYGIIGAAIATSITQIVTLFIADFFIEEYREQAFIQLKSFNLFYFFQILKEYRRT